MSETNDPMDILKSLGAKISPSLTGSGPLEINSRSCVICGPSRDCDCHTIKTFSPEYFRRLDALHGKPTAKKCPENHVTYRAGLPDDPVNVTADDWAIVRGPEREVIGYVVRDTGLGCDAPYEAYNAAGDYLADYGSLTDALAHWGA
jgi:hypothetical protein